VAVQSLGMQVSHDGRGAARRARGQGAQRHAQVRGRPLSPRPARAARSRAPRR
jgi:hypothetical protein